ncbi:hypothetical protein ScPMuIL_014440 [Solemya velum]
MAGDTERIVEEEVVTDDKKYDRIAAPTWRHYVICPVAVFYIFAYVMSWTSMVQYTYAFIVKEKFPEESFSDITKNSRCHVNTSSMAFKYFQSAQHEASHWNMYYSVALGVPAIVSNIVLGSYIDRIGRKTLMIVCVVGTLFRVLVMFVGIATKWQLGFFIMGFVIEGCSGYFINFFECCHAYVADITKIGKGRSVGMASVAFMMGGGMALKSGEKRWRYFVVLAAFFFMYTTMTGRYGVETLYQLNQPFCWSPMKIGIFGGIRGFLQDAAGVLSVKLFRNCFTDVVLSIIGAISATGYQVILAFSDADPAMYIAAVVGIFGQLPLPMSRTIASEMTPSDKQGALFASFSVVETICHMTSSVAANAIYSASLHFFAGFIFVCFSLCSLVALVLFLILQFAGKKQCNSPCTEMRHVDDFPPITPTGEPDNRY